MLNVKLDLLKVVVCVFLCNFYKVFNNSSCPPRTFLPALCKIFLDECAPDNVLEVTARAITYYLDVSGKSMCNKIWYTTKKKKTICFNFVLSL